MTAAATDDLIYDVGAHAGEDADFYLKLGYRVVAVEANPHMAEHLRRRFGSEIEAGRLTLVDRAIGEQVGEATFYISKGRSVWSTADPRWAERNERMGIDSETVTVPVVRFIDVMKEHGCPVYLKVDVEGADMLCVEGLAEADALPEYVSIESNKTSWDELVREFEVLESLGFTRFQVINQRRHPCGEFRDLAGRTVHYSFEKGASGPFGDQLDGPWLTKDEALQRYRRIFLMYRLVGDTTILRRILRVLPGPNLLMKYIGWYDTHAKRG